MTSLLKTMLALCALVGASVASATEPAELSGRGTLIERLAIPADFSAKAVTVQMAVSQAKLAAEATLVDGRLHIRVHPQLNVAGGDVYDELDGKKGVRLKCATTQHGACQMWKYPDLVEFQVRSVSPPSSGAFRQMPLMVLGGTFASEMDWKPATLPAVALISVKGYTHPFKARTSLSEGRLVLTVYEYNGSPTRGRVFDKRDAQEGLKLTCTEKDGAACLAWASLHSLEFELRLGGPRKT